MKRTQKIGRRTFLLTLGAASAAAAGGYYVLSRRPARAPKIVWSGREILDGDPRFDVCVIGSGFAGAVVAGDLARAGFRVVMLESGTAPGGPVDPRLSDLERYLEVSKARDRSVVENLLPTLRDEASKMN